ncbi:aryl-alcohol dehydrogenase-like predicted oxidoreductase [Kushneria sinocarnis]|uniref:Aryl-alcohol dehydrogenase-like predicted oxidoreductase n=1 Tax=Kushneria sinocarnis TaxID=595502 RepID=A0A420WWM6_9GAMM|nr:aldo/keto reductase [Kushneria sinocarnis]RKR03512.1 aryl-alcohol dehydrogenase-like predicted oxidoreductase [Kushneria sinocarnis]
MEYRNLGNSGLRVSTATLGTMTFGGSGRMASLGDTDVAGARRQIDMCIDRGVNFFDTANMYSAGASEEILGEAIKDKRDDILLATKVRFPMGEGPNEDGLSRQHILTQCDASLRRLQTDRIDLYQLHQWDGLTPLEETLQTMDQLVRDGKVRYYGISNFSGWHLMKVMQTCERHGFIKPVSQQIHYTPQARDAEYELMPAAGDQGLGTMIWSPLAGGLLSGKYRRGQTNPDGTRFSQGWTEPPIRDEEQLYNVIDTLVKIGENHGVSAAQVTLAWLLTRRGVTTAVVGARKDHQLEDNLAGVELKLARHEIEAIESASRPPLIYPYWHQLKTAANRFGSHDRILHQPYLDDSE